jgi:PAS domain S-box-containing protein
VEEEVEKNSQKDKLLISMLTSFLETSPNPIIAMEDGIVTFANRRFLNLCGRSKDEMIGSSYKIESMFEKRKGFLHSLNELNSEAPHKNKVSITSSQGRSIFILLENEIPSFGENKLNVYTFNDITTNEYQKLKIEHYSERLEDYIKAFRRCPPSQPKEELAPPPPKPDITDLPTEHIGIRELDDTEEEVLKRSHNGREITSEDYAKEIDSYVLEELQELSELENEISEELMEIEDSKNLAHLRNIAERLGRYASTISLLFEFADLSYAVKSLSDLLNGLDLETLDDAKQRKINLYMSNIILDLSTWRKTIFVDQDTKDIHYLDSSLFSAILQLELVLNEDKDTVDGGDDLELF